MPELYPLRFHPLFRRYLWGGRRLATELNKPLPPGDDYAESWELVDRQADQSVVTDGPLAEMSLSELVRSHGRQLLGRHHPQPRFPLLFKFLDAQKTLSVQVHPDDARASRLTPPDLGKTEAWVVLGCQPDSVIYAGLESGVNRLALERQPSQEGSLAWLHPLKPRVGDCIFIPAGLVHAIGAGLLIAEIQQSSDTTYRLYDFGRVGADGKPRPLHVEQALDAIDYQLGPGRLQTPMQTSKQGVSRLVHCEKFVLDRWSLAGTQGAGNDDRFHLLVVLEGEVQVAGDPSGRPLRRGETLLLPASCGEVLLDPRGSATLLDIYLP